MDRTAGEVLSLAPDPAARFTPEELIACYETGVFPMAEARDDPRVFLVEPKQRGVIPLERFHLPRRLARTVRAEPYEVRIDTAFAAVVAACARARPGRTETWINGQIESLYQALFVRGAAHAVECWSSGMLVGGLYGVSLGGAFFGESMFSEARDASKVALAHLVARLRVGGYVLLDAQFMTEHLAQFGAEEVPQLDYLQRLKAALPRSADFYRLEPGAGGASVLQAISHKS